MIKKEVEKILQYVQKPARYVGGELNSVVKNPDEVALRYAFCFPDTYEIGMSHLGMKILYGLVNARDDAWCERVFAPDTDMEELMRKNNIPLFALESGDYIKDFDIIGFTLQYELSYTNVLNMLDLAGIKLFQRTGQNLLRLFAAADRVHVILSLLPIFSILYFWATAKRQQNRFSTCLNIVKKTDCQSTIFCLKLKISVAFMFRHFTSRVIMMTVL